MFLFTDELYMELVTSTVAHGRLLKVDASEALKIPGVVDFVTAKDVRGENKFGVMVPDETVFAEGEVQIGLACIFVYLYRYI